MMPKYQGFITESQHKKNIQPKAAENVKFFREIFFSCVFSFGRKA